MSGGLTVWGCIVGRWVIENKALASFCAKVAEDKKGEDIRVLDVSGISSVASFLVIATGRVDKHVRAVADEIEEKVEEKGIRAYHRERDDSFRWIVLDYIDVIVHIFDSDAREFYQLEKLWGDAEILDWKSNA